MDFETTKNTQNKSDSSSEEDYFSGKTKAIPIDSSFESISDDKITFSVHDVKTTETPRLVDAQTSLKSVFKQFNYPSGEFGHCLKFPEISKYEVSSFENNSNKNCLDITVAAPINAVYTAFNTHTHLVLTPSYFLILIGQGLAQHINLNSEKLRKKFVDHDGKQEIILEKTKFDVTSKSDWETVVGEFSEEIKQRVKEDVYDVLVDDTSTATDTTRIVSEIILMDSMKSYFDYVIMCICGFPKITLKGTPQDWEKLRQKVKKLIEMNKDNALELDWWLKDLPTIIDKICEAGVDRKIDREFWGNLYQQAKVYGGSTVKGWITAFLPYVHSRGDKSGVAKNGALLNGLKSDYVYSGFSPKSVLEGVNEVPVKLIYPQKQLNLSVYGGFLGGKYDEKEKTIEPYYFWCIVDQNTIEEKK